LEALKGTLTFIWNIRFTYLEIFYVLVSEEKFRHG